MDYKKEIKDLAEKRGLDIAEDAAKNAAELAFDIIGMIILKSENKYDDLIWAGIEGKGREVLLKLIDKIDGEEG